MTLADLAEGRRQLKEILDAMTRQGTDPELVGLITQMLEDNALSFRWEIRDGDFVRTWRAERTDRYWLRADKIENVVQWNVGKMFLDAIVEFRIQRQPAPNLRFMLSNSRRKLM